MARGGKPGRGYRVAMTVFSSEVEAKRFVCKFDKEIFCKRVMPEKGVDRG